MGRTKYPGFWPSSAPPEAFRIALGLPALAAMGAAGWCCLKLNESLAAWPHLFGTDLTAEGASGSLPRLTPGGLAR